MIIVGISSYFHDSAVTIIKNDKVLFAAQEERYSRIKHDSDFPLNAINYCLKAQGLDLRDIKAIIYYGRLHIQRYSLKKNYGQILSMRI